MDRTMKNNTLEHALKELPSLFKRKRKIASVYIFGSTATGRNHRGSDLDLAIISKKMISDRDRIKMEAELSTKLRQDVHLVVFNQSSPLLQHQILKYGRLISENDPAERVRQEVLARAEYLDTKHLFREIR